MTVVVIDPHLEVVIAVQYNSDFEKELLRREFLGLNLRYRLAQWMRLEDGHDRAEE